MLEKMASSATGGVTAAGAKAFERWHTDADPEYAYDRKSEIGTLEMAHQ